MTHFLDIDKTGAAELRQIIDTAAAMKSARNGRPAAAPTTPRRWPGTWWR